MKILIVSDIPTSPINAGNRRIIKSYTDLFKSWGNEVHFLFVNKFSLRENYRSQIKMPFLRLVKNGELFIISMIALYGKIFILIRI